ncbi:MAG: indole-3-glycerol phosphate synthase TrpC [Acidobacteria bacterium]|nr:indole-3-glycerol phosphate synthase TrpC [Acidobacteriota bacterium]MBK8811147.1 indole-3-glycerol phosphate synthase TrpC [Acidobacteriota bacterium]
MQFLEQILELKRVRVEAAKANCDLENLRSLVGSARGTRPRHRLSEALSRDSINVIAEIKRASPSKGVINAEIDVAETSRMYDEGGAAAISVLTEEDLFQGSLEDLRAARTAVALPLLRKDFVYDEFQIYEAAAAGADAILLIAAMLDDATLAGLYRLADADLGLDALVEVHTREELERVKKINPRLIGINNRDLRSFEVSLDVSRELIRYAPDGSLMVTESGLSTRAEIEELRGLGFSGFLIGETLMRGADAREMLKSWR